MQDQGLLITVSFNVQDYEVSDYAIGREAWARAHGVEHVYVSERTTGLKLDAHCSAWLRLPLMQSLRGRALFYLDHDCLISAACPTPVEIMAERKGVFLARGHSGRPNSGVMLVSPEGTELFDFCVDRIAETPPDGCKAPCENGHVIWGCQTLSWNELPSSLKDTRTQKGLIVHHTGPNRKLRALSYEPVPGTVDYDVERVSTPAALRQMSATVVERLELDRERADR